MTQSINHSLLERQKLSQIYRQLGKSLCMDMTNHSMEYPREITFVVDELKQGHQYHMNFLFPDAVESMKVRVQAEQTNVQNFLSFIKYHETRVRTVLLLEREMAMLFKTKKFYISGAMDQSKISLELTSLKTLASKVKPLIGYISSHFRDLSYLKSKARLTLVFEEQLAKANTMFPQSSDKADQYLHQKKLFLLKHELVIRYYRDMLKSAQSRLEFL